MISCDWHPTKNRQIRLSDKKQAEKIICLADYLQKYAGEPTIPDPYYGGTKDFIWALDLIEDACQGLLEALQEGSLA